MPNDNLTLALKATFDAKDAVSGAKDVQGAVAGVGQAAQTTQSQVEKLNAAHQSLAQSQQNLSTGTGKVASQYSGLSISTREQSAALAETSSNVNKLLDRYDPLSAKLRQLQADFKALDAAASKGQVAGRDDSRLDSVYTKLQAEIKATQAAISGVGATASGNFGKVAEGAEKSMFATQGARRELMVLGHEAISGQFSRMPGSFMVLAERADLSAAAIGGTAAVIVGATGVVVAFAAAIYQGHTEVAEMNRALVMTGNYAGQTRGSMLALAGDISTSSRLTIGESKAVATAFAASGQIGAEAFDSVNRALATYAAASGKHAQELAPEFIKLFSDPVKGAEELNRTMHFLSAAEMEHIESLKRQGRETEAQALLADKLTEKLQGQIQPLGFLSNSWNQVSKAASGAWDSMMGMGRGDTLEQSIADQQQKVYRLAAKYGDISKVRIGQMSDSPELAAAQQKLLDMQASKQKEIASAEKSTANTKKNQIDNENRAMVKGISLLSQKQALIDKITKIQLSTPDSGSKAAAEQADAVNRIRQQIAGIDQQLSGSRGYAEFIKAQEEAAYKYQHDAIAISGAELDRRLKNNLVSYATYYDAKRELANQGNASNITRLQNEITAEQNRGNKGTPDEKYQSKTRLIALQGQLNQAEADGAKQQSAITQQETDETKKYAAEKLGWTVSYLESQGKYEEAYTLKAALQYRDMLVAMQKNGDSAGPEIAKAIFNSAVAKGQLDQISKDFGRTQTELADAEKSIQIDQQAGLISEYEARQMLLDLRRRFIPVMAAELDGLNAINKSAMPPEVLQHAEAMKLKLDSIRVSASELNRTFEYGARNAIGRYLDETGNAARQTDKIFTDMFTGIEDVGANFIQTFKLDYHNLLQTMGNDLAHLLSRQYVVAPLVSGVGSALGATGAGGAGGAGGLTGTAQNASSLYSAYSQFGAGTSTALNTGATLFGAQESLYSMYGASTVGGDASQAAMLAAQTADFGVAGTNATTAALASNTAATNGLSSTLGSAVPVIGGALTAYSVSQKYGAGAGMVAGAGTVAATGAIGGAMAGTGAMAGASAALAAVPVWGWAALAAMAIIGGQDEGLAQRTGHFSAGLGKSKAEGPNGEGSAFTDTKWFSQGEMQASLNAFSTSVATGENALIKNLGLSTSQVETINAELDKLSTKEYGFNEEHTDWTQSLADEQITADRLSVIADSLGMTSQQVVSTMSYSLDSLKAAYDDAILTDTEKLALKTDAVRAQFEKLGQVMPAGIAEYKKLVETQAAAGNSARPLYMELLKLGPAFVELRKSAGNAQSALEYAQKAAQDAMVAAQSTYDAATKNLQSAYQSEIAGKQELADQMGKYVQSMRGYRDSLMLGTIGGLSPEDKLAEAKRQMDDVARRAQLGDTAAMDQWQSVSSAFLESSQAYNASSAAYVQDRDTVLSMTQNLESVAGRQVDLQSQQISVLRSQLDALGTINSSVLSLADAQSAYSSAKTALATATWTPGTSAYTAATASGKAASVADGWSQSQVSATWSADAAQYQAVYDSAKANGQTLGTINAIFGQTTGTAEAFADKYGLPKFAKGGSASAGMYLAGENGPELIHSDAATRIYPADQTSAILNQITRPTSSGGDNQETLAELKRQTALLLDMIDALVDEGRMTREELGVIHTRLAANDDAVQQLAVVMR